MPATKDHEKIKLWADARQASPAIVKGTDNLLRFDFFGDPDDQKDKESLREISWDEFFRIFDQRGIELVYDEDRGSRFHKFVYPESKKERRRK